MQHSQIEKLNNLDEQALVDALKALMTEVNETDEASGQESKTDGECQESEACDKLSEADVQKAAAKIIEEARLEAERILEESRRLALKEADDIKAQVLYEKGRLKEQELFFDKKMDILKAGFAQLEADKQAFERDKREQIEQKARSNYYAGQGEAQAMLFAGVNSLLAVKKRYKDLIKIFHPDNLCGDTEVLQMINREYEKLMDEFGWGRKVY